MEKQKIRVLIDFERVIANVDKCVCDKLREYFPNQLKDLEDPDDRTTPEITKLLPNKLHSKFTKIYSEKGLFSTVNAYPQALTALHQMKAFGIDVLLVTNHQLIEEKIQWIGAKLGVGWIERIIMIKDKALLKGDFLIDTTPLMHSNDSSWTLVLVDRKFNKQVGDDQTARLTSLMDWKKLLEYGNVAMSDSNNEAAVKKEYIAFFRHGSDDSRDLDVLYQFENMPDNDTILNFERGTGDEDRNIFTVDPVHFVVKDCHRGIPDEVNNALLTTYSLHQQKHALPIKHKVARSVIARTVVCIRTILITLRRIDSIREKIIAALNSSNLNKRSETLLSINLPSLDAHVDTDDWKLIAFHLGQTFLLMQGTEVYTKKELVQGLPQLRNFIYRDKEKYSPAELQPLEIVKRDVLGEFEFISLTNKGDLNMFLGSEEDQSMNQFGAQSTGTIIDIKTERVVFWPYTNPCLASLSTWPTIENHPMLDAISNLDGDFIGVFKYEENPWICCPKRKLIERDLSTSATSNLDLNKYWYIFARKGAKDKGELLAVVDRLTSEFMNL